MAFLPKKDMEKVTLNNVEGMAEEDMAATTEPIAESTELASTTPSTENEAATDVKTIEITGQNFEFSQKEIRVNQGDTVRIVFSSTQGFHDWVIDEFEAATEQVQPGTTTEVEFVADQTGTFEYYCSVGEHRSLGMTGQLIVE